MTFFRREPLVGCFVFFSFQYCSTLLLPVLQLVFNCCHSNQLQVFLQKYRSTGCKKKIKRGKDKMMKWLYLSRASSLPFRRTPAASHFPFQPSYSFGDTWNSVFVLESFFSTFPVVIITEYSFILEEIIAKGTGGNNCTSVYGNGICNYRLLTSLIPSAMVRRPSLANWKVLCIMYYDQNRR